MHPGTAQRRLQFVHLVWLILLAAAAIMLGGRAGAPAVLLAALAAGAVPAMIGVFALGQVPVPGFVRGLLVIGWTLFSALAVMFSGAGFSPLTILFAIAPLIAFSLQAPLMAIEAAVFSVAAFVASLALGAMGWLPEAAPDAHRIAPLLALGAIMMTGFLTATRLPKAASQAEEPPAPAAELPPALGALSGALLLRLTPEGRIRQLTGDTFHLPSAKPGGRLANLFAPSTDLYPRLKEKGSGQGEAELANGTRALWTSHTDDTGTHLLLLAAPATADAVAARNAYFASLTHELKTPLNAVIGYADMMQQQVFGPLPPRYADYPGIILESGQELLLRVEDLLDLASAEAGGRTLRPEPVNITAAAELALQQLAPMAARAGVHLDFASDASHFAMADPRAISQIWQNLISNAIKFSDAGSAVTVRITREADDICLSVRDRGIGMSPEDLARATEPFARGGNIGGRPGTGLGLAVVRSFTERLNGRLDIFSEKGKGTRVDVRLPACNAPE